MNAKIGSLTADTIKKWQEVTCSVKDGQDKFCNAYTQSISDIAGSDWKKKWRTWTNFSEIVESVESRVKEICLKSGMRTSVFNKYRGAARKCCFYDVPFNFGVSLSINEIKEAKRLMSTKYSEYEPEKGMNMAYKEMRAKRGIRSASSQVKKIGTILPYIEGGENEKLYRVKIIKLIAEHLGTMNLKGNDNSVKVLKACLNHVNMLHVREKVEIKEVKSRELTVS